MAGAVSFSSGASLAPGVHRYSFFPRERRGGSLGLPLPLLLDLAHVVREVLDTSCKLSDGSKDFVVSTQTETRCGPLLITCTDLTFATTFITQLGSDVRCRGGSET
mmetsp:Transcript_26580/g.71259  ORF Transcript_26580/g.71259 Transcript_26580/m.71259 type:complete len:106 (-) Transcript_26580:2876-3193(-)